MFNFKVLQCSLRFAKRHRETAYRTAADLIEIDSKRRRLQLNEKLDLFLNDDEYRPFDSAYRRARLAGLDVDAYKKMRSHWTPKLKGIPLFGTYPVFEALKACRRTIYKLYVTRNIIKRHESGDKLLGEIFSIAQKKAIAIVPLHGNQLDIMTEYQLHNGFCADVTPLLFSELQEPNISSANIFLYLDRVLDPGNFGAIGRTCFFFGVDGIVLAKDAGPKSITASMSKASSGALERFPIFAVNSFDDFFKLAKESGFAFIGTADETSARRKEVKSLTELASFALGNSSTKSVVILGDEGRGINPDILRQCDNVVHIPKLNPVDDCSVNSLNVSVSAAILLYHFTSRKR